MIRKRIGFMAAGLLVLATVSASSADGIPYLPKDTEAIFAVNLKQIWDSKLVKDHAATIKQIKFMLKSKMEENREAAEFQKASGIDVFNDIHRITVGLSDMTKKPKNVLVVLEGRFDPKKFNQTGAGAAQLHPAVVKVTSIANHKAFQITPPGNDVFYLALAHKGMLVVAKTSEGLAVAIQQAKLARPLPKINQKLNQMVKNVGGKQSLSFIATGEALQQAVRQSNNPQAQMANQFLNELDGMSVTADVGTRLEFRFGFETKNAAVAQKMAKDTKDGLVGLQFLLANQAQQNPKLQPLVEIVNTLQAMSQGSTMTLQGNVPRSVIDDTIGKIEDFLP